METYLRSIATGLRALGHEVVFGYCGGDPSGMARLVRECILLDPKGERLLPAQRDGRGFHVCYSHNMRFLDLEDMLLHHLPVVKFMHGYFGTCVSGLKSTSLGGVRTCERSLSVRCLAHYFIRGCGQRSLIACFGGFKWARRQQKLLNDYAKVVVASEHMRREYLGNGMESDQITTIPLFGEEPSTFPSGTTPKASYRNSENCHRLVFLGRMTALKGPQLLPEAVAIAGKELQARIQLDFIGDGPVLAQCEQEAKKHRIECLFHGWLEGERKLRALDQCSGLIIPSLWPEPFGLVGFEVARFGIPSAAFDVGGISEWLKNGVNGVMAEGKPPSAVSLAHAIVGLLRNEERWKHLSSGAIKKAGEFTLDRHARRLLSVFEQVRN